MSQIVDSIIAKCKKENITQRDLAKRTGTTEVTISRYFNKNRTPGVEIAEKMMKACGLEIEIREK